MRKIYYFAPGRDLWFDVMSKLYSAGVAAPILWVGDRRHDENFKQFASCKVLELNPMLRKRESVEIESYKASGASFLGSESYVRAKDRALKMMDRLDSSEHFSRLERDLLFNRTCFYALSLFHNKKPDFLVMGESPHTYLQYIIYEVCQYYEVPTLSFGSLGVAPVMFLQDEGTRVPLLLPSGLVRPPQSSALVERIIDDYVDGISSASETYLPDYMRLQIQAPLMRYRPLAVKFVRSFGRRPLHTCHNIKKQINKRRKLAYLAKRINAKSTHVSLENSDYVYFPLHYEPERTTNPDGGMYHDQMLALMCLRNWLPERVKILVKEHPSQLNSSLNGDNGRSVRVYDLIEEVDGVELVPTGTSSIRLIDHSKFVSTVTGSVALEAALRGVKAVVFGRVWYAGCPNVFRWGDGLEISCVEEENIAPIESVKRFLLEFYREYGFVGFQNPSGAKRWGGSTGSCFYEQERMSVYEVLRYRLQ